MDRLANKIKSLLCIKIQFLLQIEQNGVPIERPISACCVGKWWLYIAIIVQNRYEVLQVWSK